MNISQSDRALLDVKCAEIEHYLKLLGDPRVDYLRVQSCAEMIRAFALQISWIVPDHDKAKPKVDT